ncbi:MAG TPA: VanZ family protein, partial [Candidatus Desulfofervidus auxilii]|nr:VanZ family protein [Candidatus Desulfofervidus auxilii]
QGIIITIAFGGFIELIQAFIPYRSCDILDLTADGIGGILGSFFMLQIKSKM